MHTCRWCTGKLDYSTGRFVEDSRGIVDYGFDVYAPQTFVGKSAIMGWLNMWDRNVPSAKYGFAGMLTTARKVTVKDGILYQEPIVNCEEVFKATVCDKLEDKAKIGVITIKATDLESLELIIRSNGTNYTKLELKNGEWVFDRSKSGEAISGVEKDEDSINGIRRMPYSRKKEVTLTVVMDEFSVEIFEDGRSLTSTIYPPDGAENISLTVEAESCCYERADIVLK